MAASNITVCKLNTLLTLYPNTSHSTICNSAACELHTVHPPSIQHPIQSTSQSTINPRHCVQCACPNNHNSLASFVPQHSTTTSPVTTLHQQRALRTTFSTGGMVMPTAILQCCLTEALGTQLLALNTHCLTTHTLHVALLTCGTSNAAQHQITT